MEDKTKLLQRWQSLSQEFSSWKDHGEEISRHLLPRSGRFLVTDRNRGERKHNAIYDSTGTRALRVLGAGMMAGMTSPARPWFRLTTSIPDLDESDAVKQWLADIQRTMQMVFAKSNTYRALHTCYQELGAFGTWAGSFMPDYNNVMHLHPHTFGEFALATDHMGSVNTLYREFELTVAQVVGEFGADKVSTTVKTLHDAGNLSAGVRIIHAVEPRADRDLRKRDAKNMEWKSIYFEAAGDKDKVLSESGFKRFKSLCPRWDVTTGDVYGNSPGMEALGDIKQLQHQQLRKAQAIDYQVKPPLQMPTSMLNQQTNLLPGGQTHVDMTSPNGGIRSAFEVNLRLDYLLEDIRDVRERINSAFHADLFLMLAGSDRTNMTATEVAERHEEKLLMLGPVMERQHNEILSPLIDMTFERMIEANLIPPAPPELQGIELNVEFVSMLAQAQRAIATNSIDRFVMNLGQIMAVKPDVVDKFDADYWADHYADITGLDPKLIVPGKNVAMIREQRAQAMQQQAAADQLQQRAATARDFASADTSGQNALTDITQQFSGYT